MTPIGVMVTVVPCWKRGADLSHPCHTHQDLGLCHTLIAQSGSTFGLLGVCLVITVKLFEEAKEEYDLSF